MTVIAVLLVATVVGFSSLSAEGVDAAVQFWLLAIAAELAIILVGIGLVFTILVLVAVVEQWQKARR